MGIDNSKGEWITFVDSDDILYPEALSVLHANSRDVEIVTAAIEQKNKIWKHVLLGVLDSEAYIKGLAEGNIYGYLYATLYHSSLLKHPRLHIPRSIKIGEDVLFKLDVAQHVKSVINIDDIIYFYRTNPSSLMQSYQRSIWYYMRYFSYRNKLISNELRLSLKEKDLISMLDAFYNPHLPYREKDYLFMVDIFTNKDIGLINFSYNNLKRIKLLKSKKMLILYKSFHFYKKYLVDVLFGKNRFIILD